MTELTDNPQPPRDVVESNSGTGPNLKRPRSRRRRWFLFALIPVMLPMLVVIASTTQGACHMIGIEPGGTDIEFDLTQVLANVPGPVVVWACVEQECVQHLGSSYRWTYFSLNNAALTDPQPVDVRVVVRDHGRVVFDHATRLVHLHQDQPNGPGCDPTLFDGVVQATSEGDLIQQ